MQTLGQYADDEFDRGYEEAKEASVKKAKPPIPVLYAHDHRPDFHTDEIVCMDHMEYEYYVLGETDADDSFDGYYGPLILKTHIFPNDVDGDINVPDPRDGICSGFIVFGDNECPVMMDPSIGVWYIAD